MAETRYADIQKEYDLRRCRGHNEDKPFNESRCRVTQDILRKLEGVLNKKPQFAGINESDLSQVLNSMPSMLLVSDEQGRKIASIAYDKGKDRMDSAGFGFTYHGECIDLTVFGDAIETPEQFNALQLKL